MMHGARAAAAVVTASLLTACATGGPAAETVAMTDRLSFEPAEVTIQAGEEVRWVNESRFVHTVTADPERAYGDTPVSLPKGAQPFHSGIIQPGGDYARSFDIPGKYKYFCDPHQRDEMLGTIVVKPGG